MVVVLLSTASVSVLQNLIHQEINSQGNQIITFNTCLPVYGSAESLLTSCRQLQSRQQVLSTRL